jgi:hypothetical protein
MAFTMLGGGIIHFDISRLLSCNHLLHLAQDLGDGMNVICVYPSMEDNHSSYTLFEDCNIPVLCI